MRKTLVLLIASAAFLVATHADAQAVCDLAAPLASRVCNDSNGITFTLPTTNTDGSPLNDFAGIIVYYGPTTGVCNSVVAGQSKNLGNLGAPASPLPNTKPRVALGSFLTAANKGTNFLTVLAVDLAGNKSTCTPEIQFAYDPVAPAAPTGVTIGP